LLTVKSFDDPLAGIEGVVLISDEDDNYTFTDTQYGAVSVSDTAPSTVVGPSAGSGDVSEHDIHSESANNVDIPQAGTDSNFQRSNASCSSSDRNQNDPGSN